MQQGNGPEPRGMVEDMKTTLGWLYAVVLLFALPFQVLARKPGTMGRRYVAGTLIWVPLSFVIWIGMVMPPENVLERQIAVWTLLGLVLWCFFHVVGAVAQPRGICHTMYVGNTWGSNTQNHFVESMIGIVIITTLIVFAPRIACFVFASMISNAIQLSMIEARDKRLAEQAMDQEFEGRVFAENLKRLRGRR